MALGELTRQLAKQALTDQVTEMLDPAKPAKTAGAPPDSLGAILFGQLQAMQKELKDDQELALHYNTGAETIRILEVYMPAWAVMVLTGLDKDRNVTRVISPAASIELVCKVLRVQAGAAPARINFIAPKTAQPG